MRTSARTPEVQDDSEATIQRICAKYHPRTTQDGERRPAHEPERLEGPSPDPRGRLEKRLEGAQNPRKRAWKSGMAATLSS